MANRESANSEDGLYFKNERRGREQCLETQRRATVMENILDSIHFQTTDTNSINSIWQIINLLGAYKYKTLKAAVGDYKDI